METEWLEDGVRKEGRAARASVAFMLIEPKNHPGSSQSVHSSEEAG